MPKISGTHAVQQNTPPKTRHGTRSVPWLPRVFSCDASWHGPCCPMARSVPACMPPIHSTVLLRSRSFLVRMTRFKLQNDPNSILYLSSLSSN
ncbi:hypothetical protein C2S51_031355 [Perilla frutescens var. frutescens]|nr:hypothetical protein C2S51_031355 [Perilla frutescens var. frutescens]